MSDARATPTSLDGVTSLYRRFRPGRFAELRGQDHVVRALQGAVKNDRISHAYLFSGPRGTGKTTTARILAKALNCENPIDGDACAVCDSCLAIAKGASLDVVELDAASNNGVDDIRDIIAGAWHGTPGTWKVYIFDEVHQLSKAASAALLKTLEEPPPHVVFVLATTDPHKVLPTIRSRTQHLEFRLIGADTLATLLHDVKSAAGLSADDETIEAAVRLGRGSARDALSALDQLIATGSISETQPEFDPLLHALVHDDAVEALRSLAVLAREGWDPEQLAENFAGEEPFLVALGDSILGLNAVSRAVSRMADVFDAKRASCVIAVEEVPAEETSNYGIVQPEAGSDDVFRVVNLVEKPAPKDAPSNLAIAGRYIFSPVIFDMIRRVKPDQRNEIQLTDAIQFMCDEGRRVLAVKLTPEEKRYDIGNFPSYFESFVEFALADPLYGADFRVALERLLAKTPAKV